MLFLYATLITTGQDPVVGEVSGECVWWWSCITSPRMVGRWDRWLPTERRMRHGLPAGPRISTSYRSSTQITHCGKPTCSVMLAIGLEIAKQTGHGSAN